MHLPQLARAVAEHHGHVVCQPALGAGPSKHVAFRHLVTPPQPVEIALPEVGGLRDFYDTFGGIVFYYDAVSGDAAFRLTPPSIWAELDAAFSDWLAAPTTPAPTRQPDWLAHCLVLGEEPQSGQFLLMPTAGVQAGRVFQYDPEGHALTELAPDLIGLVKWLLQPDAACVAHLRRHMRFVDDDPMVQWLACEIHDAAGRVVAAQP